MSLAQLKDQAALLPDVEKRQLIAFLVEQRQTEERRKMLADRIDDKDPANWVSLDELEKRFADDAE